MMNNTKPFVCDHLQLYLYPGDIGDLLPQLASGGVDFVHCDPPWQYRSFSQKAHGAASSHYDCLDPDAIGEHLYSAYRLLRDNSYLALWVTNSMLDQWATMLAVLEEVGFRFLTTLVWVKTNGLGIGRHARGDSELITLFAKGSPHPLVGPRSGVIYAPRGEHSVKPLAALTYLLEMATREGDTVLDMYAGTGSMALACRALRRRYVGAEIDPARHAQALHRLALPEQAELELVS